MLERGHVLDIYDDADGVHIRDGEALKKFGELRVDPAERISALPDTEFALVVMTKTGEKIRKFPIHNPEALALSTHYFEKTGECLPGGAFNIAAVRLAQAHLRFGADVPFSKELVKMGCVVGPYFDEEEGRKNDLKFSEMKASVSMPEPASLAKYAYARQLGDGRTLKMFPVQDAEACRRSVENFRKVAFEMPARRRYEAAMTILPHLAAHGIQDEFVEKTAELSPNPAFSAHMAVRREMVQDPESLKTLASIEKLAGALRGPLVAQALEEFDVRAGISHLWDTRVRNPWDSCFTVKTASVKVGEREVTKADITKLLDSGKLATMFKESTIKEFRKDPLVVFESLPGPTKETLCRMID